MKFDPLHDYTKEDLTQEENLILWKFAELIKTLISMAEKSQRKLEIYGFGNAADGIAEDFNTYYTTTADCYESFGLLDNKALNKLNELSKIIGEKRKDSNLKFWDDFYLASNKDWEFIRVKARTILLMLEYDNLELQIDRIEEQAKTENGQTLYVEKINKILVIKNK